jgi:hypothetical protein
LINDWGEQWPSEIAHVYAFRGERDKAFAWLEFELDNPGGWGEARLSPLFNNLQGDPRWQVLIAKLGVSDAQLATIEFDVDLPGQN